ncbi:hypothetical protein LCGC14_3050910, partial [marine sediment metagenome]
MADFPVFGGQAYDAVGVDAAVSTGTAIAGHASVNTKGSWTEIVASTLRPSSWMVVNLQLFSDAEALFDIGVGAATEQLLISNLYHGRTAGDSRLQGHYFFPIQIAAGTRIVARMQGSGGADSGRLHLQLGYGGFPLVGLSGVD